MTEGARRASAAGRKRSASGGRLKVTLRRSLIGHPADQGRTARALGLTKMNSSVVCADTPPVRGMIRKISHLVCVEDAAEAE
ncbi:MAG: 50S ribosomal protein L30 [Armatimonadota bacterium]